MELLVFHCPEDWEILESCNYYFAVRNKSDSTWALLKPYNASNLIIPMWLECYGLLNGFGEDKIGVLFPILLIMCMNTKNA